MGRSPFESLIQDARPRLWRAFVAIRGVDGADEAVGEALAWASENQDRLTAMVNPVGYLYRVGASRTVPRSLPPELPPAETVRLPDIEPGLVPALLRLTDMQRTAVWLVHACQWSHGEVAEAMGIAPSTVETHVRRALMNLRAHLEVVHHG